MQVRAVRLSLAEAEASGQARTGLGPSAGTLVVTTTVGATQWLDPG
jgi:hypothetical protein